MARKAREPEPPGQPEVDPATGRQLIESQIEKARALLQARPLTKDAHSQWELLARNYLEKAFGKSSPNVSSVTDVGKYGGFPMNAGESWWEAHRAKSLTTQVTRLEGLVELLGTELQLRGAGAIGRTEATQPAGHRVFLVHGQDEAALHEVARFLEHLDQEVIVLREQPNKGRTIIEKFEEYTNVGFAIVLLTPDDKGGSVGGPADSQRPRARQNVILELGYFLGRLGRSRVCALYVEGVEIPSDYSGVLYVKLDGDGGWRLNLAKELKAASLPVDMNKAL
jgi:predicted nucleotide-binding protein